ncbi:Rhomboid family protein [hydrothermal vent metagenome]|uniref:Rhomboid family protein n=1 Tax=hydrothermal vent metagenome TaxID=652676 RepID=A0A3B0UE74_9ZZZZ
MNNYRPVLGNIPPVVKNLIIINVLMLLATWVLKGMGIDLVSYFGMHYPQSDKFRLHQVITYMFMHGGIAHLFFNMFALWMFGRVLESVWGPKRFLIYYFVTGLGALALHTFVNYLDVSSMHRAIEAYVNTPAPELLDQFVKKHLTRPSPQVIDFVNSWYNDPANSAFVPEGQRLMERILKMRMDIPTIGASGAVFGILLAFGMLFPNTKLMLLFPPIPIKAKYFVIGYGALELYFGLTQPGSNIAHFAHLGGMLFGFILIKYWNKTKNTFY